MKRISAALILLMFSLLLAARPADIDDIYSKTRIKEDAKPAVSYEKDSMAIACGAKGILKLGGDMRGFAPNCLTSIVSNKAGDTLQVVAALFNAGTSLFTGVYYTFSGDGGDTWTTPAMIAEAIAGTRQYNSIDMCSDGLYPYVVINNRRASAMFGVWFTTDVNGPNGGGWSTPVLVSDTIDYMAYMPSVAVNGGGSKVAFFAYDMNYAYGFNWSTDYGTTWGAYTYSDSLVSDIEYMAASKIIWGNGNTVHAYLGSVMLGEERSDIVSSGPNSAITVAYSYSTDGGAAYNKTHRPLFGSYYFPNIPELNGDTFTYFIDNDTTNGHVDSFAVHAYLDAATGCWADDQGIIDSEGYGFGTWWYWWDSEYYPEMDVQVYAISMADLFVDYYVENNRLYTFPWQGQSILFGYKFDNESAFTYNYIDIHDGNVLNTSGRTATWNGNAYSANLVFDKRDKAVYIVYIDFPDTVTGEASAMVLKIDNYKVWRATLIPNTGAYEMEAAKYVGENGEIHIAFVSSSQDSIYYKSIDIDNVTNWEYIGPSGIEMKSIDNKSISSSYILDAPSLISSSGTVLFSMPEKSEINLSLYDVSGRQVKSIYRGVLEKGTHRIPVDTKGLSSGIYMIHLSTEKSSISKKVLIVQ